LILVLLVLVPTVATGFFVASEASSKWSSRENAQVVATDATELETVALASAQFDQVDVPSMAVSYAHQLHVSITTLSSLLGVDFSSTIQQSITTIQDNATFQSTPRLRGDTTALLAIIPKVEDGTIAFTPVENLTDQFRADLENLWLADFNNLESAVARWQPPGSFEVHVAALRQAYQAFIEGGDEIEGGIYVMTGEGGLGARQELVQSAGAYQIATQQFEGHLGPLAESAWRSLQNNTSDQKFQQTINTAFSVALKNGKAPWSSDPALAGPAMTAALTFLGNIESLVGGASADLHNTAAGAASAAEHDFVQAICFLLFLAAVSASGVFFAGRSLSRPLQKLAAAAQKVSGGEFNLEWLPDEGPREVVATNAAFNDMASTLKAVEAKTVALAAEDLRHPELQVPLPGRTGQALQATVDALATRIREREIQRQELHAAATHDRLTGVLNRAAIFDYLTHDVARRRGAGETVTVLFIDLDGLKPLNDTYGHEAGDRAIVATAQALVHSVGDYGVVGRLGGDEFLAVLPGDERRAGSSMVERIRRAVSERSVSADGVVIPLQCSIGVALAECDNSTDPMELVRQADEAMYEAKRAAHAARDQLAASTLHHRPPPPA
jgi:diguanylate cyclase (GGDEF)-like protein